MFTSNITRLNALTDSEFTNKYMCVISISNASWETELIQPGSIYIGDQIL